MIVGIVGFEPFAVKVQPDVGTSLDRSAGGTNSRPNRKGIRSDVGSATHGDEGNQPGERTAQQSPADHGNRHTDRGGPPVKWLVIHRTP